MQPAEDDDDEIFVYMGGDQQVPQRIRRARIHKSVKTIRARAFSNRSLISVDFHDGIEIIEADAFYNDHSRDRFNCWASKSSKEGHSTIVKA